jgi:hypothetical protein
VVVVVVMVAIVAFPGGVDPIRCSNKRASFLAAGRSSGAEIRGLAGFSASFGKGWEASR